MAVWLLAPAAARAEPLVGPGVGNADLLVAEGMRLYNEKAYAQAREHFYKAARAAPSTLPTYLSLARALYALDEIEHACQAYRAYVRNAAVSPDRDKAESELGLCERRLAAKPSGKDLGRTYVNLKASFFEALDKGALVAASEHLQALLSAGYAAPEMGEMAAKLGRAAMKQADGVFELSASRRKRAAPDELREAARLYQLALDCGIEQQTQTSRIAVLEGMALLIEGSPGEAEKQFAAAADADPSNLEAVFHRGLARYLAGDKVGALKALRSGLPDDPRTAVLSLAVALDLGPTAAAAELERFLFERRFER
ncbi:MAG: hypothetical protein ACOX6T_09750 [Myxococcales bacterium]